LEALSEESFGTLEIFDILALLKPAAIKALMSGCLCLDGKQAPHSLPAQGVRE